MTSDSMLYTIGTALSHAQQNSHTVAVLVEGMWLSGSVVAVDGFGVMLHSEDDARSVVRVEKISAVTVSASTSHRPQLHAAVASA